MSRTPPALPHRRHATRGSSGPGHCLEASPGRGTFCGRRHWAVSPLHRQIHSVSNPAGRSVTEAGRLSTAQCQKPEAVETSASNIDTVKLRVSSGKPDQLSCGEMSNPPAPRMKLTCSRASCSSLATDSEVNEKVLIRGMKSYGP